MRRPNTSAARLAVFVAFLALAACDRTGQQQAQAGAIQLPGERPAAGSTLNVPPDAWSGPGRPPVWSLATPSQR